MAGERLSCKACGQVPKMVADAPNLAFVKLRSIMLATLRNLPKALSAQHTVDFPGTAALTWTNTRSGLCAWLTS